MNKQIWLTQKNRGEAFKLQNITKEYETKILKLKYFVTDFMKNKYFTWKNVKSYKFILFSKELTTKH